MRKFIYSVVGVLAVFSVIFFHAGSSGVNLGMGGGPAVAAQDGKPGEQQRLTLAEKLIFKTPHMVSIKPGKTLRYKFNRQSRLGDGFEDDVVLKVSAGESAGEREVAFEFFSGERRKPYPKLGNVTSNPLLTINFNKDAWYLARRIKAKGVANYLRNRILESLAAVKDVKATSCHYNGKDVPAQSFEFAPFAKDENRHHLVHYSHISYRIIMAKSLPGGVCMLESTVPFPAEETPDHFVIEMTKSGMLTLADETKKVKALEKNKEPLIVEQMWLDGVDAGKSG